MPKPPKIPAHIRRAAIQALDLAASNAEFSRFDDIVDVISVYHCFGDGAAQGERCPISELMSRAWSHCAGFDRASLAEAACLLRDGWSPGEPVEFL